MYVCVHCTNSNSNSNKQRATIFLPVESRKVECGVGGAVQRVSNQEMLSI